MLKKNNENQNSYCPALSGGLSGGLTRLVLQPLDVLKTRFQLQVEPISHKAEISKYRGLLHALKIIYQEESIFAFWKGHVAAQILSIMYGVSQFGTFELLKKEAVKFNIEPQNITAYFYCGAVATGVATCVSFPFDVIRTRLIAQGNIKDYRNVSDALCKLYTNEGYRSLYKGLTPTIIQSLPYGGCQFAFFRLFSKMTNKFRSLNTKSQYISLINNLSAGFLSGICSKTVVYPFDLCRKRLQIQGFHEIRKNFGKPFICNGMVDCMYRIYQEESFNGFYKGLQPAIIKAAFTSSLYFTIYETLNEHFCY